MDDGVVRVTCVCSLGIAMVIESEPFDLFGIEGENAITSE